MVYFSIVTAGLLGGLLRGLVGWLKYQMSYKDVPFRPFYLGTTVLVSGLVGLLAAWVSKDIGIAFLGMQELTPAIALVIGYAGGDFIENLFKILTGKTSLYDFK
jgi:peptidoglycan biosynthesis protein MviN/MurJ (putative lipid II flippase)